MRNIRNILFRKNFIRSQTRGRHTGSLDSEMVSMLIRSQNNHRRESNNPSHSVNTIQTGQNMDGLSRTGSNQTIRLRPIESNRLTQTDRPIKNSK
jgi:hypothetical protein